MNNLNSLYIILLIVNTTEFIKYDMGTILHKHYSFFSNQMIH